VLVGLNGDVTVTHYHSTDAVACVEAAVEDGTGLEAIVEEPRTERR